MSLPFCCIYAVCTTSVYKGAKVVLTLRKEEEKSELSHTFLYQKKYDRIKHLQNYFSTDCCHAKYISDIHRQNCVYPHLILKHLLFFSCCC